MIRHKWILKVHNTLAELAMECDSCAAIEGTAMTWDEREYIKSTLREVVNFIDKKIF